MGLKKIIKSAILYTKQKNIVPISCPVNKEDMFKGKTAFITGGTGGIGQAIAEYLYDNGCNVICCGTNKTKLDTLMSNHDSGRFAVVEYNNNAVNCFKDIMYDASTIWDGLDFLICSAGVHTENVDFWKMTEKEYDRVIDINLKGVYFTCLEFAKYMKEKNRKGHILLISSSRGSEPAWSPYGVSKWGIKGITEGFAKMLFPYGITVNAIAPGTTATQLIGYENGSSIFTLENDANRMIMPEEVACLASYLVSDISNMITGQTIHLSAGRGTYDIR